MNPKIRLALALCIAHLPLHSLRLGLYRSLLGYRFGRGCMIGLGVVIAVDRFEADEGVVVRRRTTFVGPVSVQLGARTFISRRNRFECGQGAADSKVAGMGYTRSFVTGLDCLINEDHLFDILGTIRIGDGTWIAGFASQFLTHGAGTMDRDITIGSRCFLGSAVRFAPGSGIADDTIVAMGAVVTKRWAEPNVVIGGLPAKVIKTREGGDDYSFKKTWM